MAIEPTKYETLYLVRPDISPEDLLTIQNRVEQSVAANGGEIIKSEKWAERDLAYRIDNYTRGTYYIAVYASEPGAVTDIERYFNLSKNNVLRFMTVKYIEEQKPTGAGMSAPPQASGQEDQSAFQTPSLTAEGQVDESAEPPQEAQEQAGEDQEQPQETQEQAGEDQEQPQEAQEQAGEDQEQPQEAQEQAGEDQEQPQEAQEQAGEDQEQPQEAQEQAEEDQEQPQETQEQTGEDQEQPQETQEQTEEDQEQPQENEEQTKGGSES